MGSFFCFLCYLHHYTSYKLSKNSSYLFYHNSDLYLLHVKDAVENLDEDNRVINFCI